MAASVNEYYAFLQTILFCVAKMQRVEIHWKISNQRSIVQQSNRSDVTCAEILCKLCLQQRHRKVP